MQNWQLNLETGALMPPTQNQDVAKKALSNLEAMIAQEQAKIENKQPKTHVVKPAIGNISLLNG